MAHARDRKQTVSHSKTKSSLALLSCCRQILHNFNAAIYGHFYKNHVLRENHCIFTLLLISGLRAPLRKRTCRSRGSHDNVLEIEIRHCTHDITHTLHFFQSEISHYYGTLSQQRKLGATRFLRMRGSNRGSHRSGESILLSGRDKAQTPKKNIFEVAFTMCSRRAVELEGWGVRRE